MQQFGRTITHHLDKPDPAAAWAATRAMLRYGGRVVKRRGNCRTSNVVPLTTTNCGDPLIETSHIADAQQLQSVQTEDGHTASL